MKPRLLVLWYRYQPAIRLILWVALGSLLYYQVQRLPRQEISAAALWQQLSSRWYWLLIVCLLMPLNWWLEAKKWQRLEYNRWSVSQLIRQILGSTALGLMTPGRVGELAGRIVWAPRGHRQTAFWSTLTSHAAQWVVLMGFGLLAAPTVFAAWKTPIFEWPVYLAVVPLIAGVVLYYYQAPLAGWLSGNAILNRFSWWPRVRLPQYPTRVLSAVLILAAVRYGIYTFQYAGLIVFFGSVLSISQLLPGIAVLFLLQALAPIDTLSGTMLRGQIALVIWTPLGIEPLTVLLGTFSLWVINLLLPSLYGVYLIRKSTEHKTHEAISKNLPTRSVRLHAHVDNSGCFGPDIDALQPDSDPDSKRL